MRQGRFGALTGLAVVALAAAGIAARPAGGDEARLASKRYDMTLDATLKLQAPGGDSAKTLEAWSRLVYDMDRGDRALDVSIHALEMRLKEDGQEVFGSHMSREGITTTRGETTEEETFEQAMPNVQTMLRAFDTPAVSLSLDASGKESRRTPRIEGPLADQFAGLVDCLLSVHAWYPGNQERWESPAKLTMGQGQAAEGVLQFERVGSAPGAVRVKVSGTLAPAGKGAKSEEVKNGTYKVSGEQIYDLKARDWRSARWTIEMSFELQQKGKPAGTAVGTMKLAMGHAKAVAEAAPAKATAKAKK